MNKNKIIQNILLILLILLSITIGINNVNAGNGDCYNDLNQSGTVRNKTWFNKVYSQCTNKGSESGSYTFSNGDEVSIKAIGYRLQVYAKDEMKGFSSFKEYAEATRSLYTTGAAAGHIQNGLAFVSKNTSLIGAQVACYNSFIATLTKLGCIPDTTKPSIFAIPSPIKYSNTEINLTLKATDLGTGIEYAKYLWSYEDGTCEVNGHNYSQGTSITLSKEGEYTLTLCAGDKGNECSSKNKDTWTGKYFYDPKKVSCLENTKPTDKKGMIFTSNGLTSEVYNYNDPICGYKCEDGYKINYHGEGNLDDTCDLILNCDKDTLPNNSEETLNNPTITDQLYVYHGNFCGFDCKTGFTYNSITKTCDQTPECTKPTTTPDLTIFNYDSSTCEYSCKNGKYTNTHGTITLVDDTCDGGISDCTAGIITNECSCDLDMNKDLAVCNGTGGNYCSTYYKPTNTKNMIFIGVDKAISSNQHYVYNSETCGYTCETNYTINKNSISDVRDDTCEYNTNSCTAGVITDNCTCDLDINKDLKVCGPETEPGEIGIIDKDLLADIYNYRVVIPVGEDESPIDYIQYQIEDENTKQLGLVQTSHSLSFKWNMTKVDNDRLPNGSRQYTFKLIKVCDKAGNCTNPNKEYYHNVYSNTRTFGTSSTSIDSSGVADGTDNYTNIKLLGQYNNQVVPASGIDRTIDFNFDAKNTVNQDQYTNSRNAIFMTSANGTEYANRIALGTNTNQLNNQKSTDGKYDFKMKIYAPTNNSNIFKINKLSVDINGKLGNRQDVILSTNNTFTFTPLYDTEFSGDQTNGLKEGVTQTGSVIMEKDNSGYENKITYKEILLTKLGEKSDKFNFSYDYETGKTGNYFSLFTLKPSGYLDDFKNVSIQSGIYYINDGKTIKYRSNDIGGNNEIVQGLKIYGNSNINTDKQRDLIRNQQEKDVHNLSGNITKSSLKRDIKRKAFILTKGMSNGDEINNIKYIDDATSPIEITANYSGTIIIKGSDAYIKNNVVLGGLIVLKNSNGDGGKLYIDPSVQKIEAAIYVDKSILSYDGINELSSNSYTSVLENQLYIYGSVFSENTIGGSRKDPLACPYYLYSDSNFVCNIEEAQKYDLNYLRRGTKNKFDTNLGDYPVIIKYNPSIQTNPPKGFAK